MSGDQVTAGAVSVEPSPVMIRTALAAAWTASSSSAVPQAAAAGAGVEQQVEAAEEPSRSCASPQVGTSASKPLGTLK